MRISNKKDTAATEHILSDDAGASATICIKLSVYECNPYCTIRVCVGCRPSRQGIILCQAEYASLQQSLGWDGEGEACRTVFTAILRDILYDMKSKPCFGCEQDLPSQTDHVCLIEPRTFLDVAIAKKLRVDYITVLRALIDKSQHEDWRIMRPAFLYDIVNTSFRPQIEQSIRDSHYQLV